MDNIFNIEKYGFNEVRRDGEMIWYELPSTQECKFKLWIDYSDNTVNLEIEFDSSHTMRLANRFEVSTAEQFDFIITKNRMGKLITPK